jgi:hypothetical protein
VKLDSVPLQRVQRDLHGISCGLERFRQYLRTILNEDGAHVALPPLVLMNPMGKGHVADRFGALLTLDADAVAARAVEDTSAGLADVPGDDLAALVVADDPMGGWTIRYDSEYELRFGSGPQGKQS